jgi:hypothetical protein
VTPRYVLRWHNLNDVAPTWYRARRQDLWRRARLCNNKACIAQSVEFNAFNLEVVGSSTMVDIQYFFVFVTNLFFVVHIFRLCRWFVRPDLFFILFFMTDLFIHLDIFYFCFYLFKLRDTSTMHISNLPYESTEYFIKSSSHCLFIPSIFIFWTLIIIFLFIKYIMEYTFI